MLSAARLPHNGREAGGLFFTKKGAVMTSNSPFFPDSPNTQQPAEAESHGLLSMALSAAVPLRILELCRRGGPTDEDLTRVQAYQEDLSAHGEDLFFRSSKPGGSANRFNQTADAIAVLAFCPGGITIFGAHYDGQQMLQRYRAAQTTRQATEREGAQDTCG
jgi:hypothetical protein